MDAESLEELTRMLQVPGAVGPADGLTVTVTSVAVTRGGNELVIRYAVQPLPEGEARQPAPEGGDLATYASEVAEELQAWATEHVRRHWPPPPLDRNQVARELPGREELWTMLVAEFTEVRDVPGGFVGTNRFDSELPVMLTSATWRDYVVSCEIACRNDSGVDAVGTGDGLTVALDDLDETMATLDDDESFVVLHGHRLTGSTRSELPPVRGTALARESDQIRSQGTGRWHATRRDEKLSDPFDR